MPPKKGKTMDITAFVGNNTVNELPSGPSGRDEGEYYSRGPPRDRVDRERDRYADSGSGAGDNWRREGPRGGGGGAFERRDDRGFGGRDRDGGFERRPRDNFGRDGGSGSRDATDNWRTAPRDGPRAGAGESGSSKWSSDRSNRFDMGDAPSEDTRPPHLRFKKNSQDVRSAVADPEPDLRLPSGPASSRAAADAGPAASFPRRSAKPAAEPAVKESKRPKRDVDLAPNLLARTMATGDGKSALEKALNDRSSIDEKGLANSFARLSLDKFTPTEAALVIVNSLVDKKLTAGARC